MPKEIGRRGLIGAAGAAALVGTLGNDAAAREAKDGVKIIGISCSSRKGKSTAEAVSLSLQAAHKEYPNVETELIELAGLSIPAQLAAREPLKEGETDDFPALAKKLSDPTVAGIIIGSPVYMSSMSAFCKAFLERCVVLHKDGLKLHNKVAGVLAVGGSRNGGQELTIRSILTILMRQDMLVVGDGEPHAKIGAALWSQNGSVAKDSQGIEAAKSLGLRVVNLALMLR